MTRLKGGIPPQSGSQLYKPFINQPATMFCDFVPLPGALRNPAPTFRYQFGFGLLADEPEYKSPVHSGNCEPEFCSGEFQDNLEFGQAQRMFANQLTRPLADQCVKVPLNG